MADEGQIYWAGAAVGLMWLRSMRQELLWGRCGSDLWGSCCCGAVVGQIYGRGAAVVLMWVRSIWQELLCVRCGSDLWGRNSCGADMGQMYGAGAAVGQICGTGAALG